MVNVTPTLILEALEVLLDAPLVSCPSKPTSLRTYGSQFGIKRPTKLDRNVLILEILRNRISHHDGTLCDDLLVNTKFKFIQQNVKKLRYVRKRKR